MGDVSLSKGLAREWNIDLFETPLKITHEIERSWFFISTESILAQRTQFLQKIWGFVSRKVNNFALVFPLLISLSLSHLPIFLSAIKPPRKNDYPVSDLEQPVIWMISLALRDLVSSIWRVENTDEDLLLLKFSVMGKNPTFDQWRTCYSAQPFFNFFHVPFDVMIAPRKQLKRIEIDPARNLIFVLGNARNILWPKATQYQKYFLKNIK